MRRLSSLALLLLSTTKVHAEVPSVVTDIAPVHGLVSMVMGDLGAPSLLIEPASSPHTNAMRPSAAAALQGADLVVWIGAGLTPWLADPIETLAGDAAHVTLLEVEGTHTLAFREADGFAAHDHADHDEHDHDKHADEHDHDKHADEHDHDKHADEHDHEKHAHEEHDHDAHDDHAHEDHAHEDHANKEHDDHAHDEHEDHAHDDHGHDHSGTDPHAWLDPVNAALWLNHIAETLAARDPANANTYRANARAGADTIDQARAAAQSLLDPVKDRPFVVFHDAYHYFETRFGLEAIGALALSDAVPPSPSRLAEIQADIHARDVACVFSEPQFSDRLVQTVIDGTDARSVQLDPLGASLTPGAAFYPTLIRDMASRFADCLQ